MASTQELEQIQQDAEDEVNRRSDERFGGIDFIGHQGGRDYAAIHVGSDEDKTGRT